VWTASRPSRFTLGERAPGTHWIGGCTDPRAGLDDAKRKFLTLPGLELRPLGRPAHSQSHCFICSFHDGVIRKMNVTESGNLFLTQFYRIEHLLGRRQLRGHVRTTNRIELTFIQSVSFIILSRVLSARGNNKRGFSGFN
jgi:hypothetical protein